MVVPMVTLGYPMVPNASPNELPNRDLNESNQCGLTQCYPDGVYPMIPNKVTRWTDLNLRPMVKWNG